MAISDHAIALLREGISLQRAGNLDQALQIYAQVSQTEDFDAVSAVSGTFLVQGDELAKAGQTEQAYAEYCHAADLGNSYAMISIARLYLNPEKPFRGIKTPVEEIVRYSIAGRRLPPYQPDVRTAVQWLEKAVELKNGDAAGFLGCMYYEGADVPKDRETGLEYLRRGKAYGSQQAAHMLETYLQSEKPLPDADYDACLERFRKAADAGDHAASELYAVLNHGTREQRLRLGYALLAGKGAGMPRYRHLQVPTEENGIPLMPVAPRPGVLGRWIRVEWSAFPTDQPMLLLASNPLYLYRFYNANRAGNCTDIHRMRIVGTAVYRSPAFGELEEQKQAVVLVPDAAAQMDRADYAQIVQKFRLSQIEYGDDPSFLVDRAEGLPDGYSIELAGIVGERVDVLFRYHAENLISVKTIGGDEIEGQFPPELRKLQLE